MEYYKLLICLRYFLLYYSLLGIDRSFTSTYLDIISHNFHLISGEVFSASEPRLLDFKNRTSIVPGLYLGIPLQILRALCHLNYVNTTPAVVHEGIRMFTALMSLVVDFCIYKIARRWQLKPYFALMLFCSSYVTFYHLTMPSFQTFETTIFALLLLAVVTGWKQCVADPNAAICSSHCKSDDNENSVSMDFAFGFWIGFLTTVGIFSRVSFFVFAISPVFQWLLNEPLFTAASMTSFWTLRICVKLISLFVGCTIAAVTSILLDSIAYGTFNFAEIPYLSWSDFTSFNFYSNFFDSFLLYNNFSSSPFSPFLLSLLQQNFTLTPLNFLRENLNFESLVHCTIHPWHTHVLVNVPILFGLMGLAGLAYFAQCFSLRVVKHIADINEKYWLFLSSFIVPLLCLSVYPSQNAKDLLPLIVPLVFLCVIRFSAYSTYTIRRLLFLIHVWNALALVFYGMLEQGGVMEAADYVHSKIARNPNMSQSLLLVNMEPIPEYLLLPLTLEQSFTVEQTVVRNGFDLQDALALLDAKALNSSMFHVLLASTFNWCNIKLPPNVRLKLVRKIPWHFSKANPPSVGHVFFCHEFFEQSATSKQNEQPIRNYNETRPAGKGCHLPCLDSVFSNIYESLTLRVYRVVMQP